MDIEGLKATTRQAGKGCEADFSAVDGSPRRHIVLRVPGNGTAMAEFLEGGERPGLEAGEVLPIAFYTEEIGDRIVRAMAKLHMGVEEAASGYTDVDAEMISRGFVIGSVDGRLPAWVADNGTSVVIVSRTPEGGLPSTRNDPACLVFGVPNGRKVTVNADTLTAALVMLDSGQLPRLVSPLADVVVDGAYTSDGVTFH